MVSNPIMKTIFSLLLGISLFANGQTADQIDRIAKLQGKLLGEESAKSAKARQETEAWKQKQIEEQEFLKTQNEERTAKQAHAQIADESAKDRKVIDADSYAKLYDLAIDKLEARFPQCFDEESIFFKALDAKVMTAKNEKNVIMTNPEWVYNLAKDLASELSAQAIPVIVKDLPSDKAGIKLLAAKNETEFKQQEEARILASKQKKDIPSQSPIEDQPTADRPQTTPDPNALFNATMQRLYAQRQVAQSPTVPQQQTLNPRQQCEADVANELNRNSGVTIDIARAQTLARSSNNPAAQREGYRMLAEAELQRKEHAINQSLAAGNITNEQADLAIMRLEQERTAAETREQLDDIHQQQIRNEDELLRIRMEAESRSNYRR